MKNSNKNSLLKEFKETLISKKYNKYVIPIGIIDYHLEQLNNQITNEVTEYDSWDQDLLMYKKYYENIRNAMINKAVKNLEWNTALKKAIDTYPLNDIISSLSVNELAKENNLNFCISYKKGYKGGSIVTPEMLTSNSKKSAKIRKR